MWRNCRGVHCWMRWYTEKPPCYQDLDGDVPHVSVGLRQTRKDCVWPAVSALYLVWCAEMGLSLQEFPAPVADVWCAPAFRLVVARPASYPVVALRKVEASGWLLTPINPLNAELNPVCHLLALLGAHHILHVSRVRVNAEVKKTWRYPSTPPPPQ